MIHVGGPFVILTQLTSLAILQFERICSQQQRQQPHPTYARARVWASFVHGWSCIWVSCEANNNFINIALTSSVTVIAVTSSEWRMSTVYITRDYHTDAFTWHVTANEFFYLFCFALWMYIQIYKCVYININIYIYMLTWVSSYTQSVLLRPAKLYFRQQPAHSTYHLSFSFTGAGCPWLGLCASEHRMEQKYASLHTYPANPM